MSRLEEGNGRQKKHETRLYPIGRIWMGFCPKTLCIMLCCKEVGAGVVHLDPRHGLALYTWLGNECKLFMGVSDRFDLAIGRAALPSREDLAAHQAMIAARATSLNEWFPSRTCDLQQ